MARTKTQPASIETKALAASTKSEGMRMLYEAGYKVSQVAKVFGIGYAFAYGVAKRGGFAEVAADRRPAKGEGKSALKAASAKTVATKPAAKAKTTSKQLEGEVLTAGQKAYRARKARLAAEKAAEAKPVAKAPTTVAKKAAATKPSAVAKVAAKVAGRPTAARRAANRAPRKTA